VTRFLLIRWPIWAMVAALTAVLALSQAFRTAAAIVAGPLKSDLGLSDEALGAFAGAFHLSFAALQIVMGVALDVYGLRRTLGVASLVAVLGAMVSALAPNLALIVVGQLLIGAGCAPAFLAATVFIANRYPADHFTQLTGMVLAFSGLGMLATGTPLAWVIENWSWRAAFLTLAGAAALTWLATLLVVSDPPRAAARETLRDAFKGVGAILAERHTLGIVVLGAVTYAAFLALRGLWAVPLFAERHGYTLLQSGHVVAAASIAAILGPPLFGRLDPGGNARRYWIIGSSIGYALLFGLLAMGARANVDVALTVLAGGVAGYIVLQHADVRSAYSSQVAGRAFATFNTAVFLGVAFVQWGSGYAASIASARGADPVAAAFASIAAFLVLATAAFTVLPWPRELRKRSVSQAPAECGQVSVTSRRRGCARSDQRIRVTAMP
jgi:predicted MFS family arabinose efflux permease